MTNYREILRLHSQVISQKIIALSIKCSRNTVASVVKNATSNGIFWPLPESISDYELAKLLFPEKSISPSRKLPDGEYIHKKVTKSEVTLSLLWNEYC